MKVSSAGLVAVAALLGQSEAIFCFFRPLFLPLPILTIGSGGGGGGGGGAVSGKQQSCPTPSCAKQACTAPLCLRLTDPTPYGEDLYGCHDNGVGALFKEDGSFAECDL
ncbi:hypothetical protein LZ30DRAFT_707322 [Colletotrichum cereale]|nr:hypothetical protein LZ30DRAFT_707322 [Colletotrichum cereale]